MLLTEMNAKSFRIVYGVEVGMHNFLLLWFSLPFSESYFVGAFFSVAFERYERNKCRRTNVNVSQLK